jgi:hypothetical protein
MLSSAECGADNALTAVEWTDVGGNFQRDNSNFSSDTGTTFIRIRIPSLPNLKNTPSDVQTIAMFAALYFIENVTEESREELLAEPKDPEVEESEKEDIENVSR